MFYPCKFAAFFLLTCISMSSVASSAALDDPSPIDHVMNVTRFGLPGDSSFVFCDSQECALRTSKHIDVPVKTSASPSNFPMPSTFIAPAMSPKPDTASKKRKAIFRKKVMTKPDCPPVTH